jgi:hypothetical protein
MKSIKYLMGVLCISALFATGCSDDSNPNTANKGKTKPTVAAEVGDTTKTDFHIVMTPAKGTVYYGCVVYEGSSNSAPTALDIMTDNTSGSIYKNLFAIADSSKAVFKIDCTKSEHYQAFYVGINADGLLGDVKTLDIYIEGAHPAFTPQVGTYAFTPSATSTYGDDSGGYSNPKAGQSFDVVMTKHSTTEYYLQANWFNSDIIKTFIGKYDSATKTLSFSGDYLTSSGSANGSSMFGRTVWLLSSGASTGYVFYGAGSTGKDPFVIQMDADGYLKTVTAPFEIDVYSNASGSWSWVSLWDAMGYGTSDTITH